MISVSVFSIPVWPVPGLLATSYFAGLRVSSLFEERRK